MFLNLFMELKGAMRKTNHDLNTLRPSVIVRGLITSTGVVLVVVSVVLQVAFFNLVAVVACHYFYAC